MAEFSFLIPARNEAFCARTVEDVLAHARGDFEIIIVLDGAWADPPIKDHPRVRIVYKAIPIGQRAATNLAARLATGTYICKLDAHCAIDDEFDVKMMAAIKEYGRDTTAVPAMCNLHAFSWACSACHNETYQGPTPTTCAKCKAPGPFKRVMYWDLNAGGVPGRKTRTEFWNFDHDLHFQYWNDYKRRPEAKGDLVDVMSSIGACFAMRRDRFIEIGGLDEAHGSWGQMGTSIACKSWLSGGRHVVNKRTWFAHLFRTSGADFSFPYPMRGSDQEKARAYSRHLWLGNNWSGQTRPLAWLIEKFWPVPGWADPTGSERLIAVKSAGAAFTLRNQSRSPLGAQRLEVASEAVLLTPSIRVVNPRAQTALLSTTAPNGRQEMAPNAVSLSSLNSGDAIAPHNVVDDSHKSHVTRVVTSRQVLYEPRIDESMDVDRIRAFAEMEVAVPVSKRSSPVPATSLPIDNDLREDAPERFGIEIPNREILGISHASASRADVGLGTVGAQTSAVPLIVPSNGLLYYSDCRGDQKILQTVRDQIQRAAPNLPLVSVTLQPLDFGRNIVLPLKRGPLTMFRQILAGLEALETEIVFFVEHDVIYHSSHFAFTPSRDDVFYFNQRTWRVDAETGRALFYYCNQVSGLCANRLLLLEHYRKRVACVEAHGFDRNIGFEPGSNRRVRQLIDPHGAEPWMSQYPNVDIKTRHCLTQGRWSQDQFRNKQSCRGWTESSEVPGWGETLGRFNEFLAGLGV